MADVTRQVHKDAPTTGDHTTIAAAISYLQGTWNGEGIGTIEILQKAEFVEENDLDSMAGTPSGTNYVVITTADAAWGGGQGPWPGGTYDSSISAGVKGDTAGLHVFACGEDYLHFKKVAVYQSTTNTSDEGITNRLNCENLLIEKCYIQTTNTDQQDCFYNQANSSGTPSQEFYDCVMVSGGTSARANINHQISGGGATTTRVTHCTLNGGGANGTLGSMGGCVLNYRATGPSTTISVDNCIMFNVGANNSVLRDGLDPVQGTWDGANNIGDDASPTAKLGEDQVIDELATAEFDDIENSDVRFTDYTSDTDANYQLISGTGFDYAIDDSANVYSGIDTRIEDEVDIAGNARPTGTLTDRDVGAYEVAAAGGAAVQPFHHRFGGTPGANLTGRGTW